jgi:hypothetical protein
MTKHPQQLQDKRKSVVDKSPLSDACALLLSSLEQSDVVEMRPS